MIGEAEIYRCLIPKGVSSGGSKYFAVEAFATFLTYVSAEWAQSAVDYSTADGC